MGVAGAGNLWGAAARLEPPEVSGGNLTEPLGLALRRMREGRGLTIEELADKSGVAASTIRETERGESTPRTDTIARLGKPLGLTFAEVWSLQRRRE